MNEARGFAYSWWSPGGRCVPIAYDVFPSVALMFLCIKEMGIEMKVRDPFEWQGA